MKNYYNILVIGSSSGLGFALTDLLVSKEHKLLVTSSKNEFVATLDKRGVENLYLDFSDNYGIEPLKKVLIEKFWPDVIYINSGKFSRDFHRTSDNFRDELNINYLRIIELLYFLDCQTQDYPRVIFLNSVLAISCFDVNPYYSGAKAGVLKTMELLNMKYKHKNVNVILGPIDTAERLGGGMKLPAFMRASPQKTVNLLYHLADKKQVKYFYPRIYFLLFFINPLMCIFKSIIALVRNCSDGHGKN